MLGRDRDASEPRHGLAMAVSSPSPRAWCACTAPERPCKRFYVAFSGRFEVGDRRRLRHHLGQSCCRTWPRPESTSDGRVMARIAWARNGPPGLSLHGGPRFAIAPVRRLFAVGYPGIDLPEGVTADGHHDRRWVMSARGSSASGGLSTRPGPVRPTGPAARVPRFACWVASWPVGLPWRFDVTPFPWWLAHDPAACRVGRYACGRTASERRQLTVRHPRRFRSFIVTLTRESAPPNSILPGVDRFRRIYRRAWPFPCLISWVAALVAPRERSSANTRRRRRLTQASTPCKSRWALVAERACSQVPGVARFPPARHERPCSPPARDHILRAILAHQRGKDFSLSPALCSVSQRPFPRR